VDRAPARLGRGLEAFPDTLAGLRIKAAELAITVDAIDVVALEIRRADDRVQAVGVLLVAALARP